MTVRFLSLDEVLTLHTEQITLYGGSAGVRDLGLLESAVASPKASFDGEYLHTSVPEMAAAYLFNLAQNHPFIDGNKRISVAAAFMFLLFNDHLLVCDEDELVDLTMRIAKGESTKTEAAIFLMAHITKV